MRPDIDKVMILVPAPAKRFPIHVSIEIALQFVCTTSTSHWTSCFGELAGRGFWIISIRPFASHLGFLGNGINAFNTPALSVGALFKDARGLATTIPPM
jgi:hypothetical protein